jgi:hypothetical protein
MAGYYARIIPRGPHTRSYFPEDDDTSMAVGWTHGCLSCARKVSITIDNLERHIEELEDDLRLAKDLLLKMREVTD